jgi:hypothetical protein
VSHRACRFSLCFSSRPPPRLSLGTAQK